MKRREFIKKTVPVSVLPLFMGGFTFRAYGRSPYLETLVASGTETARGLVGLPMNGGEDGGEHTHQPAPQTNTLSAKNRALKPPAATGLHPSMPEMQSLFIANKLAVVQGVTYPNPNLSHFRATDIWLSASDYDQIVPSGWLGRYLDQEYPDFPNGYPNVVNTDPLAIQIGSVLSPGLQGPSVSMGMAITSPSSFYQIVSGGVDQAPNTDRKS